MADYTQTYINNDMSKLNTVLQTLVTNGIVGAVDYDDSDTYPVFKIYADAEKTQEVFRIAQSSGYLVLAGHVKYTFTATASDGSTLSSTAVIGSASSAPPTTISGYFVAYGYTCSSGVLISILMNEYTYPSMWLLITKNQNGSPVFIWTNNTNNITSERTSQIVTNMNKEYIVAASDVAPLGTISRVAPTLLNQVQIAPFVTCCAAGDISYTPDAGRVLAGGMNSFIYDAVAHEMTFEGATWLTNGYWALKVGATA